MTFDPPDYRPRFLFTKPPSGYPSAIAWAAKHEALTGTRPHRRHTNRWGAWLRRRHLAILADRRAERLNAIARLADGAAEQGYFSLRNSANSGVRRASRLP